MTFCSQTMREFFFKYFFHKNPPIFPIGVTLCREHMAAKVNGGAPMHSFGYTAPTTSNTFMHLLQHCVDPIQTAATDPLEEAGPSGLVRFHGFGLPPISILIDRNLHLMSHASLNSPPLLQRR